MAMQNRLHKIISPPYWRWLNHLSKLKKREQKIENSHLMKDNIGINNKNILCWLP